MLDHQSVDGLLYHLQSLVDLPALTHQFVYTWKLAKQPPGVTTITATIGYPGTTTTTRLSEQITITS